VARRVSTLSARLAAPRSPLPAPAISEERVGLHGKVSIERDGDPTSLVHMATGQAVIEDAVRKSGVLEAFFTDKAIAVAESDNERDRLLALDTAVALSIALDDDHHHHRHRRRRRKPQKSADLGKSDALLLLKSLDDAALIVPALRLRVSKQLIGADGDGVLALINAFRADPLSLASELVALFGEHDAAAPPRAASSTDGVRAVHFADGTKAQSAAPSRPRRTRKAKKKQRKSNNRPEPAAANPFLDSPANRAFEERLKKIREGL